MFDGMVKIFGVEKKVSKTNKPYHVVAIDKGIDTQKFYYPVETLPFALNRGDEVEMTIEINQYDKPIVTKIVK